MRYACSHCKKKFRTEGAVEMHEKAKHAKVISRKPAAPRKGRSGAFLAGVVSGVAVTALGCGAIVIAANANGTPIPSGFAKAVFIVKH